MTLEQKYKAQLIELGIYHEAFDPLIDQLAQTKRRKTRLQKAWAATAPPGGKPSFLDPHYQLIVQAERDILILHEKMGLTPQALRKLRGAPDAPVKQDLITERLGMIAERVKAYELPDVSILNTLPVLPIPLVDPDE